MKIQSIYEHVENAVGAAGDENIKLFFRHSIRGHISDPESAEKVRLIPEGVALARWFGKSIEGDIGFVGSSKSGRCLQTLECIFEGHGTQHKIEGVHALSGPQVKDGELCDQTFKSYNFDACKMFYDIKHGKSLPGMNSLERSVQIMLDYIFSNGGAKNTLDLYCSHDFMLILLVCAMFDYPEKENTLDWDEWPCMLEGMVFTGTRENFKASWRGQTKIFENYLTGSLS